MQLSKEAVCLNHTFKHSEKSSHKRCFQAHSVSPRYNIMRWAEINQATFKSDGPETSEISEGVL